MKKLLITLSVLVNMTGFLFSQSDSSESKFVLGVLGGLNIPKLSGSNNNPLSSNYTSRLGEAFGVTASYFLKSNFALRADLLYSSEGGKRNGIQAMDASSVNPQAPAGTYLYANYYNESILNYVEIPVMLKYFIPVCKSSTCYIDFGAYAGYLLNAKQETSGSSLIYADKAATIPVVPISQSFNATTTTTSSINPFNFGLTGGVGITQQIVFGEIFLDARGAYGLTAVQKNSQDGQSHNGYLLISFGYAIPL